MVRVVPRTLPHDLERWREAAVAYDAVEPAFLVGPRAWRYEHLLEQRADCWLRSGDIARAQSEFEALLDRWEKSPELAAMAWGCHVAEAARGELLGASLLNRANALGLDPDVPRVFQDDAPMTP